MSIETRTYDDADRAKAAIDELASKGFSDVKALFKPDHVRVVVNARFGEGRNAAQILDSHGPLTPEEAARSAKDDPDPFPARAAAGILAKVEDPATPLSNILGLRVLINDPAPLSNWLGWPTLFGSTRRSQQRPAAASADGPSKNAEAASATAAGTGFPDNPSKDEEAASGTPVGEGLPDSQSNDQEASSGTPVQEGRPRRRPHSPS